MRAMAPNAALRDSNVDVTDHRIALGSRQTLEHWFDVVQLRCLVLAANDGDHALQQQFD
jgi:hypothetical protein